MAPKKWKSCGVGTARSSGPTMSLSEMHALAVQEKNKSVEQSKEVMYEIAEPKATVGRQSKFRKSTGVDSAAVTTMGAVPLEGSSGASSSSSPSSSVLPFNGAAGVAAGTSGISSSCTPSSGSTIASSSGVEYVGRSARKDTPVINISKRACRASATEAARDSETKAQALKELRKDKSAASAMASRCSWLATWQHFHWLWFASVDWLPLTCESIEAVAAMFKKGRYRSFGNFASRSKEAHIVSGYAWTQQLEIERKSCHRSVMRGIGPPRQSGEFSLGLIFGLGIMHQALICGAPVMAVASTVIATFWLLREIEMSHLRHRHVALDRIRGTARLTLSASKTDPEAFGCTRSWGCVCQGVKTQPCGYCAVVAVVEYNERTFRQEDGLMPPELPLFPQADGSISTKPGVVDMLEQLCESTGQAVRKEDGDAIFGGHSFRITGARWLAALGIEVAIIMLLARWESATVLRYIQESPLRNLTAAYQQAVAKQGVPELLEALSKQVQTLTKGVAVQSNHLDDVKNELSEIKTWKSQVLDMPPFVLNPRSGMMHRTAHASLTVPQSEWRAMCSWRFGQTKHRFLTEIGEDTPFTEVCDNCCPEIRAELMRRQLS